MRNEEAVAIEPQAMRLLEHLILHRDRIVPKDELVEEIWEGRAITDAALNTRIRSVRRALGDDGAQQSFIKTYPKRGFRFVADLEPEREPPVASGPQSQSKLGLVVVVSVLIAALVIWFLWQPATSIQEEKPSIAVLRFDNLGDERTDGYFADGLTEELTTHLARYRELFVISSATVFSYAAEDSAPVEIARDLGVGYGLRGSVRRDEGRIRVTSELINIPTGKTIWSEQFEREITGIFELQDEITQSIAGRLVPEILQSDVERVSGNPTEDMGAWDLFLRARDKQADLSKASQIEAVKLARQATRIDPQFAAAYSLVARAQGALFFFGWADDPEATLAAATEAAKRAIELDERDPQAHAALGYIYRFTGHADLAVDSLELAADLNPNDARIRLELAHTLDWFRLQERALPQIDMAIRLSPRDPLLQNMYFYKGHILFHLDRFDESLEAARKLQTVAKGKTWLVFHQLLRAANLAQLDRMGEAQEAVDAALALNPNLSISAMRRQFEGSKNHPENRRAWLASLEMAGMPL